ncbi:putative lipoprotein [Hyphomonas neptunium ATCC 15444]|uniref:Putative lipoprotein n=2 Tax=Hyphomonas TaxID=85 RepID=Q0C598_HYPNA|nr:MULTISPECIES: energy transducer TonB [Hyphomonas]ABI77846.1 putative lipoprotein [Hyphomonas neptunium ATCC 15444]KCZ95528.1 putative lipoprotein [Hyphomonas hirschiana VP5]
MKRTGLLLAGLLLAGLALAGCAARGAPPPPLAMACPVAVEAAVYPRPDYPPTEAQAGYEDDCLVRFDVDASGAPVNLDARCTYKAFAESAEAAMKTARFDRALARKLPAGAQCASYPISYELMG